MKNKEEIKSFIWQVVDSLRNAIVFRDLEYSTVRLVFIKYAVDNYIGASTVEEMQACARAQKVFAMRDVDNGIEYLKPVLEYIDKAYGLDSVLFNVDTVNDYSNELFGYDNIYQKKNANAESYKGILRVLGTADLEETSEEKSLGPMLVDALIDVIISNSYRNGYASDHTTKPQLNKLVSELLRIQTEDRYCDFASGVGISTLQIVKDKDTQICNADINRSVLSVSTMLLIEVITI